MTQLHTRFTDDQVKVLLKGYCQGLLKRAEVQEMLGIGKTRFFALVKEYRADPEAFSVAYERSTRSGLPATEEMEIERELLVANHSMPPGGRFVQRHKVGYCKRPRPLTTTRTREYTTK